MAEAQTEKVTGRFRSRARGTIAEDLDFVVVCVQQASLQAGRTMAVATRQRLAETPCFGQQCVRLVVLKNTGLMD